MADVVSQLEAVIAGIEDRTEHTEDCHWGQVGPGPALGCLCQRDERIRTEIACTVERMVTAAAMQGAACVLPSHRGENHTDCVWAAAFRATQEQETKK